MAFAAAIVDAVVGGSILEAVAMMMAAVLQAAKTGKRMTAAACDSTWNVSISIVGAPSSRYFPPREVHAMRRICLTRVAQSIESRGLEQPGARHAGLYIPPLPCAHKDLLLPSTLLHMSPPSLPLLVASFLPPCAV